MLFFSGHTQTVMPQKLQYFVHRSTTCCAAFHIHLILADIYPDYDPILLLSHYNLKHLAEFVGGWIQPGGNQMLSNSTLYILVDLPFKCFLQANGHQQVVPYHHIHHSMK